MIALAPRPTIPFSLKRSAPEASALLQARAAALVPELRAREDDASAARRVPVENIRAMKEAELFRVARPVRFGGLDLDFDVALRIAAELAKGCGSTSWVYGVLILHDWFLKLWPNDIQEEIWAADPNVLISSSLQPRPVGKVDGGYLLSGDWPFSSGCDHSRWAMIGGIPDGLPPKLILVPLSEAEIVDDWRTLGLRGTGSKTLRFRNVFVADRYAIEHRRIGRVDGLGKQELTGSPWYDTPVVGSGEAFAATILGMATRALELVSETLRTKVSRGVRLADVELHQLRVGEASAVIDQARYCLLEGSQSLAQALRGGDPVAQARADARSRDIAVMVRRLREAVDTLSLSHSSWIYDTDPFQRIHRDVFTAATHFSGRWENFVLPFGKALINGSHEAR